MSEIKEQTLFGFPVVVSDVIPPGELLMGRWPTAEDVREHGSVEKAIEAQARQWVKVQGIAVD